MSSRHRIDLYAVGAPPRHGQNLYRQNIAAYDHAFAREVLESEGLDAPTISEILDTFPERGRRWNENVSAVSAGYTTEQHDGSGHVRRISTEQINERENFFHKPQVNLNHYARLTERSLLATVLYYSGGKGGGTGTSGSMQWDFSGPSRVVDYDATLHANRNNGLSRGILRNSHKPAVDAGRNFQVYAGTDGRHNPGSRSGLAKCANPALPYRARSSGRHGISTQRQRLLGSRRKGSPAG